MAAIDLVRRVDDGALVLLTDEGRRRGAGESRVMVEHLPLGAFEIFVLCFVALGALTTAVGAVLAVATGLMRPSIATVKTMRRRLPRRTS